MFLVSIAHLHVIVEAVVECIADSFGNHAFLTAVSEASGKTRFKLHSLCSAFASLSNVFLVEHMGKSQHFEEGQGWAGPRKQFSI